MKLKLRFKTWWRWRCGKVESWQATEVNPLSGRVWNECTWVNDCYIVLVQSSMNRGQWLLHCLCAVIDPPQWKCESESVKVKVCTLLKWGLRMTWGGTPTSLAYCDLLVMHWERKREGFLGWHCTQILDWHCTLILGWHCTQILGWHCTLILGWHCTQILGWHCSFILGWHCTQIRGWHCTSWVGTVH